MNLIKSLFRNPWCTAITIGITSAAIGFALGWCTQADRSNATIAKLQLQNAETAARALAQARTNEQKLQAEAEALSETYQKEQKNAQNTIEKLRADLRAGTLRLSVPHSGKAAAHPDPMPADSAAQYPENRTRLDPETADALVAITADGDTAIRNLNRCIDQYTAIRKAWNAK